MLIIAVSNVWRVPMTPELVPNVSVWVCTEVIALLRSVTGLLRPVAVVLEGSGAGTADAERPRPEAL